MSSFKNFTVAVAVLGSTGLCSAMLNAEPLMTIFEFSKGAYADTLATNSIARGLTNASLTFPISPGRKFYRLKSQ